jgi:hypothetical protein
MKLILVDSYAKFKDLLVRVEVVESSVTFNGSHYIIDATSKVDRVITLVPKFQRLIAKSLEDLENDKVYYFIFNPETKEVFTLWQTIDQFETQRLPDYVV